MADLRLEGLHKSFAGGAVAVAGVDLAVADGEVLVLLGPSGCGKSTLLRLVAGLERPDAGRVWIGGEDVTDLPPARRDVAMVFQSYALYPHMTVEQNVAVALRLRRLPAAEIRRRVEETAELLDVAHLLERRPRQLSGGQRQRVALARAIVRRPRLFLLDEPLSNLDALLRERTRRELRLLFERLGTTVVHVTHDQAEAMTLADRLAVMRHGRLLQVAPPEAVYHRPAHRFVAGFLGSPPMNLWPVRARGGRLVLDGGEASVPAPAGVPDGDWVAGVRPERLGLEARGGAEAQAAEDRAADGGGRVSEAGFRLTVEVVLVEALGARNVVTVALGPVRLQVVTDAEPEPGVTADLWLPSRHLHLFAADGGALLPGLSRSPRA